MNGMDWVEFIRKTEDKMYHLHRAIDGICNEPDYKESVSALTEVIRDYQLLVEKAKNELRDVDVHRNHHRHREAHLDHHEYRDYDHH
ncbi:hypothetical protein BRE01_63580 [Brevibacillus reuszeri]|uniref:Uncharacterized protein n=1 Tax=Brevibacillus reuszeri TaxID=54915 RepID=A0A0K9YNS0_9BACL|nr:hypothetical protein [Brevibacillus reuszeri]KNB70312.1 hypothetical protein ADS79_15230 [Brevibacillus reuszeri]MED1859275.1 hypothetical protein [Brevibacillus reuszeri]GED72656.1 hypothetical protein BRE01_63580 [Brevibacillus reuszeri]